ERPFARQVAEQFGAEFTGYEYDGSEIEDFPRMVWYLDEPFMENGLFLTNAGFRESSPHVDMVIAGNGADQLFGTGGFAGGKPLAGRYLLDQLHCRPLGAWLRRRLKSDVFYGDNACFKTKALLGRMVDYNDWFFWGFDDHELDSYLRYRVTPADIRCFKNKPDRPDRPVGSFPELKEWSAVVNDLEHYVCQNVLTKSSRMAECYGVQLREAYLDSEVIDFLLSLEIAIRSRGTMMDHLRGRAVSKLIHRHAMADVLPQNILTRPKQGGFVPLRMLLLQTHKRRAVFDYLAHSRAITEFFKPDMVKRLLAECDSLYGRQQVWPVFFDCKINQVMNMLSLAVWYDVVYTGEGAVAPPGVNLTELIGG
ncbi:MAG: asparagine synthase C-terminal domain-containing protein, partial [bacterium]